MIVRTVAIDQTTNIVYLEIICKMLWNNKQLVSGREDLGRSSNNLSKIKT
jgi:hypothetical protein